MSRVATVALAPLSAMYSVGVRMRNALYRRGTLRSETVGACVISVGNLTVGGTGKTPLVEWIAREVAAQDKRVCILARGYGRKSTGRVLVSDGTNICADCDEAGDEALLLAENLQGKAAVVCDADRVAAAHWAIQNLSSEVLILDDGFQHRRIARNLDIVTIDARNPWGGGQLLPAGILREPVQALSRAQAVVITRADEAKDLPSLSREISSVTEASVFISRMKLARLARIDQPREHFDLSGVPLLAVCGIGNPESFFSLLRRENYGLCYTLTFRDHYRYTQAAVDRIVRQAREHNAQEIITTVKDAVKLRDFRFDLPCYVAEIVVEIGRSEEFRNQLFKAARIDS